jgi:hypothetical protein
LSIQYITNQSVLDLILLCLKPEKERPSAEELLKTSFFKDMDEDETFELGGELEENSNTKIFSKDLNTIEIKNIPKDSNTKEIKSVIIEKVDEVKTENNNNETKNVNNNETKPSETKKSTKSNSTVLRENLKKEVEALENDDVKVVLVKEEHLKGDTKFMLTLFLKAKNTLKEITFLFSLKEDTPDNIAREMCRSLQLSDELYKNISNAISKTLMSHIQKDENNKILGVEINNLHIKKNFNVESPKILQKERKNNEKEFYELKELLGKQKLEREAFFQKYSEKQTYLESEYMKFINKEKDYYFSKYKDTSLLKEDKNHSYSINVSKSKDEFKNYNQNKDLTQQNLSKDSTQQNLSKDIIQQNQSKDIIQQNQSKDIIQNQLNQSKDNSSPKEKETNIKENINQKDNLMNQKEKETNIKENINQKDNIMNQKEKETNIKENQTQKDKENQTKDFNKQNEIKENTFHTSPKESLKETTNPLIEKKEMNKEENKVKEITINKEEKKMNETIKEEKKSNETIKEEKKSNEDNKVKEIITKNEGRIFSPGSSPSANKEDIRRQIEKKDMNDQDKNLLSVGNGSNSNSNNSSSNNLSINIKKEQSVKDDSSPKNTTTQPTTFNVTKKIIKEEKVDIDDMILKNLSSLDISNNNGKSSNLVNKKM